MSITIMGAGVSIHSKARIGKNVTVGHCSCIGYGCLAEEDPQITIGDGCHIGAFCLLAKDIEMAEAVMLDHYCRIDSGTRIGKHTRILYGVQISEDVIVGADCIIGGDLIDRMIVEDRVTFSGAPAHSHRDPTGDWDDTAEPSPTIRFGTVVGVGALILGGVTIGPNAYIAAGETVRTDVPPNTVLLNGELTPLEQWRGFIRARGK